VRRVVLDSGVFVSALITPAGVSGRLLGEIREGAMELIVSSLLLAELERVLKRRKFRRYIDTDEAREFVALLCHEFVVAPDPGEPPSLRCADPADDYLVALAKSQNAVLVSGDKHLLDLGGRGAPVLTPADLLATVA
jgi:uncharacterized protein